MILSQSLDVSEIEGSQGSRTRRLLPQVPPGDKSESGAPCVLIRHDPYLDRELPERVPGPLTQQDSSQRLRVQDDVDPDSLSDTSRSEDGSILERKNRGRGVASTLCSPGDTAPWGIGQELPAQTPKSTSFYIGSDDGSQGRPEPSRSPLSSQSERDPSPRTPPTTVLIRHLSGHEPRRTVKPNSSAPNLQTHDRDSVPTKDPTTPTGAFVRQESFTKDRPSDDIQVKRLPHISSHPTLRDLERAEASHDPQAFLQEAERAFSSPEDKQSSRGGKKGEDSMSGESDVDTASTVSMVSSKNAPVTAPKKRSAGSGTQKERSAGSGQEKGRQPTARERLSEKRRSHTTTSDSASKAEAARRLQLRRSAGNRGSLDLSEGQQNQGQNHWVDAASSSDHESSSRAAARKRLSAPPLKDETPSKAPNKVAPQVLTRSNSLSAPRPTRASMLRRARLGDASDNEGTETDRASQSSDHGRPPSDSKKMSRLDILAMPRKRTGSFTAPSDTESTSGRTAPSTRTSESTGGSRKASTGEAKQGTGKTASATAKLPSARVRSSTAKHTNGAGE